MCEIQCQISSHILTIDVISVDFVSIYLPFSPLFSVLSTSLLSQLPSSIFPPVQSPFWSPLIPLEKSFQHTLFSPNQVPVGLCRFWKSELHLPRDVSSPSPSSRLSPPYLTYRPQEDKPANPSLRECIYL